MNKIDYLWRLERSQQGPNMELMRNVNDHRQKILVDVIVRGRTTKRASNELYRDDELRFLDSLDPTPKFSSTSSSYCTNNAQLVHRKRSESTDWGSVKLNTILFHALIYGAGILGVVKDLLDSYMHLLLISLRFNGSRNRITIDH